MGSLQGTVICPVVRSKQAGVYSVPLMKAELFRSEFWGFKGICGARIKVVPLSRRLLVRRYRTTQCSFSSSSDGTGSMAENFNESDEDYVNSSVVEAVEVKSDADGFIIKMRDGRHLRCVHNNPQGGHLQDYAPHPAIVLKMEDGTGLLLPIIVLEMPSVLLMAAVRNVQIARPTLYQVVKEMIDKMGYEVKLVRVTKRVHEAYFAQLYLTKVGNETESVSFDLRPSDAINIAVRCKVPIQVNKYLAYSDGMRVVESEKLVTQAPASDGLLFTELDQKKIKIKAVDKFMDTHEVVVLQGRIWILDNSEFIMSKCKCLSLDNITQKQVFVETSHVICCHDWGLIESDIIDLRPSGQPCVETKEFNLLRNMLIAAVEERYRDAAQWRDQLTQLRARRNWT